MTGYLKRFRPAIGARRGEAAGLVVGCLLALPPLAGAAEVAKLSDHAPLECDVRLSVAEMAATKAPKARQSYHIELSIPSLANPYITAFLYGAYQAAAESGVRLTVDSGRGFMDPAAQLRQLENAASRRFDALILNPADPDGLVTSVDELVAAGTPVFEVGTLSNSTRSYKVVQDDYQQGRMAAQIVAQLLPKGGTGIVQGGPANASWARRRVAGFLDGLKASPSLRVAATTHEDINPTEGLARFTNAAQSVKVDWIYAVYNLLIPPPSLPPEFRAAVYVGGGYDAVLARALHDGSAKAAIPDFPVAVGYLGVSEAVRKLNGETVPARSCLPSPAVTAQNANDPVWARFNTVPDGWKPPSGR